MICDLDMDFSEEPSMKTHANSIPAVQDAHGVSNITAPSNANSRLNISSLLLQHLHTRGPSTNNRIMYRPTPSSASGWRRRNPQRERDREETNKENTSQCPNPPKILHFLPSSRNTQQTPPDLLPHRTRFPRMQMSPITNTSIESPTFSPNLQAKNQFHSRRPIV